MIAEQKIEHAFLQPIIENIEEGVIITNADSNIIAFNSMTSELFDLKKGRLIPGSKSSHYIKKVIWEDGSSVSPRDFPSVATLETGEPFLNKTMGILTLANNLKWFKIKSRRLIIENDKFVITTFSNITEIHEANAELKRKNLQLQALVANVSLSEKKFSGVFHYSGIGIALLSINGQFINANPSLCKMLGYSAPELTTISFHDITHPADVVKDLHFTKLMLKKRIDTYEMEKRFCKKDGDIVWAALTVSLVWTEAGTPDFFICQIVNITESKNLLKQLNEKNHKLQVTSEALEIRMKQLKDFNHIVAHNLRGPVANIDLLLQMLANTPGADERSYYLQLLVTANKEQNKTLDELVRILQVELYEEDPLEVSSFEEVINKVKKDLMGSIINKKARIQTTLEVNEVEYPKIYLESIIYNLVSNSLKYSHDDTPPVIMISSTSKDDKVQLKVSDNGLGMDLTRHEHELFKPNKTFHTGYDSKGIGLYMTKKQVENRGGSICAESQVGIGSTFTICL